MGLIFALWQEIPQLVIIQKYGKSIPKVYYKSLCCIFFLPGIFKNEGPYKTYIDINGIADLKKTGLDANQMSLGTPTNIVNRVIRFSFIFHNVMYAFNIWPCL